MFAYPCRALGLLCARGALASNAGLAEIGFEQIRDPETGAVYRCAWVHAFNFLGILRARLRATG